MFGRFLLVSTFLLKFNVSLSQHYKVPDVDFVQSMTDGNAIAKYIMEELLPQNIKLFKEHYEAKKPSKMPYHETPLIPKVMHHIWDGPIPPLYQNYLNECKKLHPNWEFKFWSDKDIDELGLEYRDVYDKARSYAGRSDIARYEILYRFGGVYRDMDVKCFRPIDDLNHKYKFFAPIEPPPEVFKKNLFKTESIFKSIPLNNGIIGSNVGNSILKTTLDIIRKDYDGLLADFDHNPKFAVHPFAVSSSLLPLTKGFVKEVSFDDQNIALPTTYFFSLLNRTFTLPRSLQGRIKSIMSDFLPPAFHSLKPEGLMFHNARVGKHEVPYCTFKEGSLMRDVKLRSLWKALTVTQLKMWKTFRAVYLDKFKTYSLSQKSQIPQIIHFVVFDHHESSVLEKNLSLWKMLNGDFEIKIWDKEKIREYFQDIELKHDLSENLRFYLGLRILEKFGGTYVGYKALPHQPIFELNNQYDFYAGLMPIIKESQKLSLSHKMLGSRRDHPIISKTLCQINFRDSKSLDALDEALILETYRGIYLDGKNVVLPAVYFEPITITNTSWIDKIQRLWKDQSSKFSHYISYVVVE